MGVFAAGMFLPRGLLAWTIHETPARPGRILSGWPAPRKAGPRMAGPGPDPFPVADSGKERNTDFALKYNSSSFLPHTMTVSVHFLRHAYHLKNATYIK